MVSGGASEQPLVHRWRDGSLGRGPDDVAVEAPLEIRLDGTTVTTTMRTPGADVELAVGFLHAEGLLAGASVRRVRHCTDAGDPLNVIVVETGGTATVPVTPRLAATTAACGTCGIADLDALTARLAPLPPLDPAPTPELLAAVPAKVRPEQHLFERTGGVHAAGAVGPGGEVLLVREDVGRHNAVDKVVGQLHLDGRLPATGLGLFVSGRAGFELVQKAWAGGFAWLVAVGAPSSLAVSTARRAGLLLAGFAGPGSLNLYAPAESPWR